MEDLDRALGSHHRDLGARPGEAQVVAEALRVHHDVGAAERLAQDHAHPGDGGLGVGEGQLGTVADHPPPLEVLARQEARRVDQGHQRQVEGVAEADEPGALLRRGDVEGAGQRLGLVGHEADGAPVDAAEGGDQLRRPPGPQLGHAPRRRPGRPPPGGRRRSWWPGPGMISR